jgi:hypothetical protein
MDFINNAISNFKNRIPFSNFKKADTYVRLNDPVDKIASEITKQVFSNNQIKVKKKLQKEMIFLLTGDEELAKRYSSSRKIRQKLEHIINKSVSSKGGPEQLLSHLSEFAENKVLKIQDNAIQKKVEIFRGLDELDPNRLPVLQWNDETILSSIQEAPHDIKNPLELRKGDIIFFQNTGKLKGAIDKGIVGGQKLAQRWIKGKLDPVSETYTHVAIYIGNGKFAEATPGSEPGHDVRILDFNHFSMKLKEGEGYEYRITRPKDPEMARRAAELAEKTAEYKDSRTTESVLTTSQKGRFETQLKYDKPGAGGSLLGPSKFDNKAKKKAIVGGIISHQQQAGAPHPVSLKKESGKDRSFFCSYYVSYCLQAGNASVEMPEILEKLRSKGPKGVRFAQDLEMFLKLDLSIKETVRALHRVSKNIVKAYPDILDSLTAKYDPKYMSPQRFRKMVSDNPDLYQDVMRIVPPPQSKIEEKN